MARALGRYELLRPLARGGMAEVYLARRRAAGIEKWLVVKRMRPETSGDPRFLDLFVREARLSMSLVHQNIVPVFDFGRIDDQVFLAMERVEGKDLGSSLARGADHLMPPLLAAFIAAECCQALDYAHQRKSPDGTALGIVHRDVTPRNVLLSWSGEVKLTDFGIAALAGDATSRLLGTPHYMAPEQARSEPIDPRADIYAIGLVLREAVTGTRPRPGSDRDTVLDAARRGELLPWADGTPQALRDIIDRATSPAADGRFPDARSMLEALDNFMVEERSTRKGESPARQLAAWLAVVWEGAVDDLKADAAIEANHLVSFLDDGHLDVLGTGTVRSMIATSADSQPVVVPTGMADGPPLGDDGLRPGLVSSSHTPVASGSFETLSSVNRSPVPLANPPDPAATSQLPPTELSRHRFSIASWVGVALVGAAAGAIVLVIARSPDPTPAPPATEPIAIAPTPTPTPTPTPPTPPTPPPQPAPIPPATPPPATDPQSGSAKPVPPRPTPIGRPPRPTPHVGSAAPIAQPPPPVIADPTRPLCKVRVNFTPWAYYTTDGDATRHETPSTVELPAGKHRLHVWNPELHIERDITLTVPGDRDAMNYSEPLRPSSLPE